MIAKSSDRVVRQTKDRVNERIHRQTETNIAYLAGHPEQIDDRLKELDWEWDVERTLETMASSASLFGLIMGITRNRKFFFIPLVVQTFFFQHAAQGWCPPLPLLRHLGFRTQAEIDEERYALKALRGDFQDLPQSGEGRGVAPVLEAVRR